MSDGQTDGWMDGLMVIRAGRQAGRQSKIYRAGGRYVRILLVLLIIWVVSRKPAIETK